MSDRMGEIRGRLAAATPGPERPLAEWLKRGWRWWKAPSTGRWPERCQVENWSGHCIAYVQDAGLAEFLAKAPADLAWLIGEVERTFTPTMKLAATAALSGRVDIKGAKVGILDGDVYGPNVPLMFGLSTELGTDGEKLAKSGGVDPAARAQAERLRAEQMGDLKSVQEKLRAGKRGELTPEQKKAAEAERGMRRKTDAQVMDDIDRKSVV